MRFDTQKIAVDILNSALAWEPQARLLGNVRADEIALVCFAHIMTCPKCGSEAWSNIDCDLCNLAFHRLNEEQ